MKVIVRARPTSPCNIALPAAAAVAMLLSARIAAAGFSPPGDLVLPDRTLSSIHDDIAAAHWSDVVDRVEASLATAGALAKADDRLLSIGRWVDEQITDPAARTAFTAQYEKVAGASASAALASAVKDGDVTAIADVADRYPWTQAAAKVHTEMAIRLAALGDLHGVQSLLHDLPNAPASIKPLADAPADGGVRPVLFSAPWYRLIRPIDFARLVPVGAKDVTFIASPTAVAALNGQGRVLWSAGQAPPPMTVPPSAERIPKGLQQMIFGEHSESRPAVWTDPAGVARVVVARQSGVGTSALIAYRAETGAVLWNTADNDDSKALLPLGSPLVQGRYVYSLAFDFQPPALPKTCVIALELPSGRLLWRAAIGEATPPALGQDLRSTNAIPFVPQLISTSPAELSADDLAVYASLEGGSVISIDRFAGQTNWIADYPARVADQHELNRIRQSRNKLAMHRWHDRVVRGGDLAVVAPVDSASVVAYDARSGRQLWKFDNADAADLIGWAGGNFVLAGQQLIALKPDGSVAWQVDYTNDPVGPGMIDGESILTPTASGLTTYAGDSGKSSIKNVTPVLTFESLLKQAPTKKALDALGLLDTFGPPVDDKAAPTPPPTKPVKTPPDRTHVIKPK